jgi:galactokinase
MKTFTARAHGRVNLIGEHTDYNGGWVLPTTIPQFTEVTLTIEDSRSSADSSVTLTTSKERKGQYRLGHEQKTGTWIDYLQGATKLLRDSGLELGAFSAKIHSTVPEGSGLSSSAALEISFLKALREAFNLPLEDVELARIGQRIENEFVGARVGIMDQMACSLATAGEALFLDTQSLTYESITIPRMHCDLLVINSGLAHQNSGGDYNTRRAECEAACKELRIHSLRELSEKDLPQLDQLPETLKRRARHVLTENARVFRTVQALKEHDLSTVGRLFKESHASMRDDYAVSIPEIDQLVEITAKQKGVFGARLTGGGFGGSIVALTEKNLAQSISEDVCKAYREKTGHSATVLVAR